MKRREILKVTSAAALGMSAFPLGWAAVPAGKKRKVLYFTRSAGYEHAVVRPEAGRPSHSEKVLIELGKREGFEIESTKDGRVFEGSLDRFDVIAFFTSGDLTKPNKQGTPPMTLRGKHNLLQAIVAGKGFVGFHAASDSFHSEGPSDENQTAIDPYIAMLGGEFISHGEQQEASLIISSGKFPGVGDLGCAEGLPFTEEWYALKNFARDLHVILVQETQMMAGDCYQRPNYPCTWARLHGQGRVFYTSLGHREDVWTNPFFQAMAVGALSWAMGAVDADVTPNMNEVTPLARQLRYGVPPASKS